MNLDELVTHYIAFRRTLGARYGSQAGMLQSFCRVVGPQMPIANIGAEVVATFLKGSGAVTSTWFKKYEALNGFFHFAISRGHLAAAPLPKVIPKPPAPFVPYIYTPHEVRRLLDAIPSSLDCRAFIQPDTLRAILLLLYGAGLRVSEALALSVADVDLPNALVTVRESKFFKSRLVPVGPQLAGVLTKHARWREASHAGHGNASPFFLSKRGAAISRQTLEKTFRRLRARVGICRSDGVRYQPRLHDMRHSFAVHRLIQWYQQGMDVQRLLHHLSVYLGHVNIRHTQIYLTMTPELLQQASMRFERYSCGEANHA
jgi:integrase/recombinase XerD